MIWNLGKHIWTGTQNKSNAHGKHVHWEGFKARRDNSVGKGMQYKVNNYVPHVDWEGKWFVNSWVIFHWCLLKPGIIFHLDFVQDKAENQVTTYTSSMISVFQAGIHLSWKRWMLKSSLIYCSTLVVFYCGSIDSLTESKKYSSENLCCHMILHFLCCSLLPVCVWKLSMCFR